MATIATGLKEASQKRAGLSRRSSSKLKTLSINDRMLLQLPRLGLATEEQLEYLEMLFPDGGQPAIQALLNLMDSGVRDCVMWQRESWVGDSIGSVTGVEGDKLDLMEPVAMPPTGGCNLLYTEGVLENMLAQLHSSVEKSMKENIESTADVEKLALDDVPRQVCMLVQRVRFSRAVQRCIMENRQMSTITRASQETKAKISELLLKQELGEGQRATLIALQQVIHEQLQVVKSLQTAKGIEELQAMWQEQMKFCHDDKDGGFEIKIGSQVVPIGHEYCPPTMLITTEFTHNLRWAFLQAMGNSDARILVLIGPPGCGKTGMLRNCGQLVGMLPTLIRCTEQTLSSESWWRRHLCASKETGGGRLAPTIITQAHRAPEAALEVALRIAAELEVALCLTMSPGEKEQQLRRGEGALAGAQFIVCPPSDLYTIAAGQLAAEGLKDSDNLGVPLAQVLETLENECSKQQHYDFGPRTLMQLCTQIGADRKPFIEEKVTVASVVERCLLPKLAKNDVPVLQKALKEHFKLEPKLLSPSDAPEGRWHKVAENIKSITKIEPDCIVLPVPGGDEEIFKEEFCKMLNRNGSMLVNMEGSLSDYTVEELIGTKPRRDANGNFEKPRRNKDDVNGTGGNRTDGKLVTMLRQAMDTYVMEDDSDSQFVWIYMRTGNINPAQWECLHELLNDSGCLNLPTGEQLRLAGKLRFLFVMPDTGNTPKDTFSRAAVVYTDPP
jgi:hypothetical protein